MSGIQDLPPELTAQVISYLPSAQAVTNLAQTSKQFRRHVDDAAWKTFVWSRFPSISVPADRINGDWKSVAHSLTSLSRSFDRKAFLARYLQPTVYTRLPDFQMAKGWRLGAGQSMGYRPVIDSYEELLGERIWQRKDVLAWGAGSQIAVRIRNLDRTAKDPIAGDIWGGYRDSYDHFNKWYLWKPPRAEEGRDDIISMKLLPGHFQPAESKSRVDLAYCTSQGRLSLVSLPIERESLKRGVKLQAFATKGVPIKAMACSSPQANVLAAAYDSIGGVNSVSLFPIADTWCTSHIRELDNFVVRSDEPHATIWSTDFLTDNRLAVGVGPSGQQVHVYDIKPSGAEEFRRISWTEGLEPSVGHSGRIRQSAGYCIKPLPESSCASNNPGELFLSGGYDGAIRLHDLRDPKPSVAEYSIWSSEAAIYSLATVGRERILAGTAQHGALTMFDIRVPGGRNYFYPGSTAGADEESGTLIWLTPWSSQKDTYTSRQRWRSDWRIGKSPVYSVSSPSPYSPFIYAGIEGNVMELAFTGHKDETPEPIFRPYKHMSDAERSGMEREVLNLTMNDEEDGRPVLLKQRRLAGTTRSGIVGYDERWEY